MMRIARGVAPGLFAAMLLAGASSAGDDAAARAPAKDTSDGTAVAKPPAGDEAKAPAKTPGNASAADADAISAPVAFPQPVPLVDADLEPIAPHPQVNPVKFDYLYPFLPQPIDGWRAEPPLGAVGIEPLGPTNEVLCRYRKKGAGDAGPTIELSITDGGHILSAYEPYRRARKYLEDHPDRYVRRIKVKGSPGFETWYGEPRLSGFLILVKDRFLVQLSGNDVDPEILRQFLDLIRLDDLTKLE
jgi:hypothetical protein